MNYSFRHTVFLAASAVLILSLSPAQGVTAQNAKLGDEDVFIMDTFDVTSRSDVGYLSQNAESATRLNVPISDIAQNIVVFNEEFLSDIMAETIEDVAMYDPTVTAFAENDSFAMRGMGAGSAPGVGANYFNGFEQTSWGIGSQTLVNTARVEVLKGPNAVLYGTGAFGGTINRVSKKPTGRKFINLNASVDSFGYYQLKIDENVPVIPGKYAYRVNVMWADGETWWNMPRTDVVFAPSISWNITKKTTLAVDYTYQMQKNTANWTFPIVNADPERIMIDGALVKLNRRLYLGEEADQRKVVRNVVYADLKHEFTRWLLLRGMFNAEFKKQETTEAFLDPTAPFGDRTNPARNSYLDTMGVRRYYRIYDMDSSAYRGRLELVSQFQTFGAKHQMIFGGSLYTEKQDNMILRTTTSSSATGFPYADIITHVPGLTSSGSMSLNLNRDVRMDFSSRSAYANDLISIVPERLIMQAGVRYITTNQKRIDHISTHTDAESNYDEEQDKVTYSLGAVWHLTKNKAWTLYANHCSTFQPNFGDMDYADDETKATLLPPMTARQLEGGIKYVWRDKLSMLVCYYDILQKNTPESYVDPFTSENRKRVIAGLHSQGVEVNFNFRPTRHWSLFGGYAYTDCINESTGARHYRTPRHAVSLFNNYKLGGPLSGLSFNIGVIWRGDSETLFSEAAAGSVREEPAWSAPDFLQLDVGASYALKIGKMRWTAAIKVRNATDRLNYITASNVAARLTAPRIWTFSLAARF